MSWLFILPAICAGLIMTPRLAAGVCMIICTASALVPYQSFPNLPYADVLPPQAIVDLTVAFITHVSLLMVIFRTEAALLQLEMDRRVERELGENELMTSILQGMTDGMLLVDQKAQVLLTNSAARTMLGTEIPAALDRTWADTVAIRTPDGDEPVPITRLRTLMSPPSARRAATLDIAVHDSGGQRRLLQVSSQELVMGRDRSSSSCSRTSRRRWRASVSWSPSPARSRTS